MKRGFHLILHHRFYMSQNTPKYSVIIPVYNRAQELSELLGSLATQTFKKFEVIVVDDGSSLRADVVVDKFREQLDISYYYKPNTGQGKSRNYGFEKAKGDYLVIFDSDCEIPPHYFDAVEQALHENKLDVWGGPDMAAQHYTLLQKSISYCMTSVLTTGGIRGGKQAANNFQPRSFNMGMRKEAFQKSGGFHLNRLSEDIELSIRLKKMGYKIGLIEDAFVYHKRRTSLLAYFQQVYRFGKGRASLIHMHRDAIRPAHLFPTFFVFTFFLSFLLASPLAELIRATYLLYFFIILFDASIKNASIGVGVLSVVSALIQHTGYGIGFIIGLFSSPEKT